MEMFEKVAKALSRHCALDDNCRNWQCHTKAARAALEPLREPSEEMVEAMRRVHFKITGEWPIGPVAEAMGRAMIDAALKEQP